MEEKMNTVISVLEGFEKLAYKFLLSIIFIPKTIVQITVNPGWVPDYIRGELKKERGAFNAYLSPVILLLVVALIPAVIISFLPTLGTNIIAGPAEGEADTTRLTKFEAETKVISGSSKIFNQYSWHIEHITYDQNGNQIVTEIYRETYNEFTGKTVIEAPGSPPETIAGFWATDLMYPNQNYNTSRSTFYYMFAENDNNEDNEYNVYFDMVSFDPDEVRDEQGRPYFDNAENVIFTPTGDHARLILESNSASRYIVVPALDMPDQRIYMPGPNTREPGSSSKGNISDLLKRETTIFLALGLLFPPLMFALAMKLLRGEELSEDMLRESFYIQCYYFSPLSLAIWATYYAGYFLTPDVFFYRGDSINFQGILLPALLAILWFIGVETQAIAHERPTQSWKALLLVVLCITILGVIGRQAFLFAQPYSEVEDILRRLAILLYPLAAVGLLVGFVALWWKRRREEGTNVTRSEMGVGCVSFLVIAAAIGIIGIANSPAAEPASPTQSVNTEQPVSLDIEASPTALPPASEPPATETPAPTEIAVVPTAPALEPFYTEQFDGNLETWSQYMTSGLETQVQVGLGNGSVVFQLTPQENSIPAAILINEAITYSDVMVEAVSTNLGTNANGASLICHFNDNGWYQFTISNGGTYEVWAYDAVGAVDPGYTLLYNSGSALITPGKVTNTYTAVCRGSDLTLYANGNLLYNLQDTKFNFTEGSIGIGASSPQNMPVELQFDSLTVSQP
jgi:hypothetical protein